MSPIAKYFKGKGREVASKMKEQYGDKKGEQVFYATAKKHGQEPAGKPKRKTFGQRIGERMDD